jgi:hypothetical protein
MFIHILKLKREEQGHTYVAVLTGLLGQMQYSGIPIKQMAEHLNFSQKERQGLVEVVFITMYEIQRN